MTQTLKFVIGAGETARQEETFTVSSACSHLCFRYDLSKKYTFLVFLMIKDPSGKIRFLKQLGYSDPVIVLGKDGNDTTIGGVPGALPAGTWQMTVFVFAEHLKRLMGEKIQPFSVLVTEEAAVVTEPVGEQVWTPDYENYDWTAIRKKGKGWYQGDFHTHTRLSDGKETTENASRKAERMGLDFYTPTEHNAIHTGWPETSLLILPGIEITTLLGHANLFGITHMPRALERILEDKEEAALKADLEQIQQECRKEHWLFSINHPFLYIWKWLYGDLRLDGVHCLEIINDPTYEADPEAKEGKANQRAVALADLLWADGHRICAIGGSDSHNTLEERYPGATEPSVPGDPATFVYMEDLSAEHLLEGVRSCNCYVTRHCRIETGLLFGGQLPEDKEELPYRICLRGQKEKPEIFYLHNGKRVDCRVTGREDAWEVAGTVRLTEEAYQWIRFGAEAKDGGFLFYGNAITRGTGKQKLRTFGEAVKQL